MTTKQVAELYARAGHKPPPEIAAPTFEKVHGTRRKIVNGIEFRSTLEANVYQLLKLWEQAGEIEALQVQPLFILQDKAPGMRAITYRADFSYERRVSAPGFVKLNKRVVIDAKGYRMEVYRIKAKLFRARYPNVEFQEWDRETLKLMERSGPRKCSSSEQGAL